MVTDALTPAILKSGIVEVCYHFLSNHKIPMIEWVCIHFGVQLLMRVFLEHITALDMQEGWVY